MCRSIHRLREGEVPASAEDIEAAALQYVRKISGFTKPADHNREVFDAAVTEIALASQALLHGLQIRGAKRAG
ncbi:MAG: DUF2277 domain-containing protein [Acidimicrobiia bacterium]|nr:DUF2277 domain-containing protein [Acidimicrobiia bacterium]